MRRFTFDVSNATRGELAKENGRMCAIGQYCHNKLGWDKEDLIRNNKPYGRLNAYTHFSSDTGISYDSVIKVNDLKTSWKDKIKKLREIFRSAGIQLRVINKWW